MQTEGTTIISDTWNEGYFEGVHRTCEALRKHARRAGSKMVIDMEAVNKLDLEHRKASATPELLGVKRMLEGLLEQTEAEIAEAPNERMKTWHHGARVALLAALNYEPLRPTIPDPGKTEGLTK